ncbi:MAG: hypothetical protein OIF40_15460 [Mangrovicoccus sp.]|nr:hypothetical protein [Mangrovicoccus sp.]
MEKPRFHMSLRIFALLALGLLAACASPQQRCVQNINRDLSTVNRLIAETELNLSRGFTYETEIRETGFGVTGCFGTGRYYGSGVSFCGSRDLRTVNTPVPIDPDTERRKLAGLKKKQEELTAIAARAEAACAARYPG